MCIILKHREALIRVEARQDQRAITVEPAAGLFMPVRKWVTSYPPELIEHVLRVKGPAFLCDEIMRDESPKYVQHRFHWDLLSYVATEDWVGRRVLDFGSGSGASSMVLSRMFPRAEIVGVELMPEYVALAEHRAAFHQVGDRVSFQLSPDPKCLPANIGEFDYVVLSAVYEHLLPEERQTVLALVWSRLKPGGVMFVNETPNRWFPIETHTTGLPLINYLPDRLTLHCARRFSQRVNTDESWSQLLRRGIRGGTAREILGVLNRDGNTAELLTPTRLGVKDRIDLWYRSSTSAQNTLARQIVMWGYRAIEAAVGVTMTRDLSLAIRRAH